MAKNPLESNEIKDSLAARRVQELLETGCVFGLAIDSNFYITTGGGKLNVPFRFKLASCSGRFKHLVPFVWEKEITKHLYERVEKAKDKALSISEGDISIFDNPELLASIKALRKAAADLDLKNTTKSLWTAFAGETHVIPVNVPRDSASIVLNWYFDQHLPFENSGDKKHEFPDAFALHSLSKYAEDNDLKVIVVTKDSGAYNHCKTDKNLIPFHDVHCALGAFDSKELIDRRRKLSENASKLFSNTLAYKLIGQFVDYVNMPYYHGMQAWGAKTSPTFQQYPRIIIDDLIKFEVVSSGCADVPPIAAEISEWKIDSSQTDSNIQVYFRMKTHIIANVSCEISAIDKECPNNKYRQSFPIEEPVDVEGYLEFTSQITCPDGTSPDIVLEEIMNNLNDCNLFSVEFEALDVTIPENFEYRGFA